MFLIASVVNALVSRSRCVADHADRGLMVGGAVGLVQRWSPTASLRGTGIGHRRGRDQRHRNRASMPQLATAPMAAARPWVSLLARPC
jgi:hypothetical protein